MLERSLIPWLVLLVSAVVALSAIFGAGVAATQSPPLLFMIGLELSVVAAGVFGVLLGLGRFQEGRAIGLLCVGSAFAVASHLAAYSTGPDSKIGAVSLIPYRNARIAAGALLILIAAFIILIRRPAQSLPRLAIGLALAAVLAAGGWWVTRGGAGAMFNNQAQIVQIIMIFAGFCGFCALTAASGHFLIRAFALGVEAGEADLRRRQAAQSAA